MEVRDPFWTKLVNLNIPSKYRKGVEYTLTSGWEFIPSLYPTLEGPVHTQHWIWMWLLTLTFGVLFDCICGLPSGMVGLPPAQAVHSTQCDVELKLRLHHFYQAAHQTP